MVSVKLLCTMMYAGCVGKTVRYLENLSVLKCGHNKAL